MEEHSRPIAAWIERLRDLSEEGRNARAAECRTHLAYAAELARAAPEHAFDWYYCDVSLAQIKALLDAGGFESLAIRLMGKRMSYLLSCSANGSAIATVAYPELGIEVTCMGSRPALALAAGWAALLADAFERRARSMQGARNH